MKLGQKTKIVRYFDNSEWNFFFMANILQVWLQFAYEANQAALSYQLYVELSRSNCELNKVKQSQSLTEIG